MPMFRFPYNQTLLGALLRNESGGRNIIQGNIGDINNRTGDLAKGYFQITDATWRDYGGLNTGYARASDAPYAVQAQIAAGIPLRRWGPSTINAMRGTGRPIDPNRTLGENLAGSGEDFRNVKALYQPHGIPGTSTAGAGTTQPAQPDPNANGTGPVITPTDPNATPPPPGVTGQPATPPDTPMVAAGKKLGGVLGELQKNAGGGEPMKLPEWRGGAGPAGPTLAELIQQYMTSQMRGGAAQQPVITPQQGGPRFG